MLTLFGADYSVYVRAARIALEEKGIPYTHVAVNVFQKDGPPKSYLSKHPFGKIPALDHEGFELYETTAILRYTDEAFDGPRLQPSTPTALARMTQIQSILDSYAYQTLVWDIYVQRIEKAAEGDTTDEGKVASALPVAHTILNALENLADQEGPYLLGTDFSLADCMAAPMFDLFCKTKEACQFMAQTPKLESWWHRISRRQSFLSTGPLKHKP